jgi:hypothetical protein
MPLPGLFSAYYWPGDGVQGEIVVTPNTYTNYPYFFDGSMIGMNLVLPKVPRWARKVAYLVALWMVCRLIFSKDFTRASEVVREIAVDPSSRNLSTWGEINRATVSNQAWGENMYRALAARVKFGAGDPNASTLLEVAYHAFHTKGR